MPVAPGRSGANVEFEAARNIGIALPAIDRWTEVADHALTWALEHARTATATPS